MALAVGASRLLCAPLAVTFREREDGLPRKIRGGERRKKGSIASARPGLGRPKRASVLTRDEGNVTISGAFLQLLAMIPLSKLD